MNYSIRAFENTDAPQLEKLFAGYMRETYGGVWGGSAERLERDSAAGAFEILAAENAAGKIAGFIAWTRAYDLHWCLKGGTIIDFYVAPPNRGRGLGLLLAIAAAAEVQKNGGAFLHGGAVESRATRRFYNRIAAIQPNGECYLSGRAFRHLAGLSGASSVREIIKNLPETKWNYEP